MAGLHQEINFHPGSALAGAPFFSGAFMARSLTFSIVTFCLVYVYDWQSLQAARVEMEIVAHQEAVALERLEKLRPVIAAVTDETSLASQLEDAMRTLDEKQAVLAVVNDANLGDTSGFSRHLRSLASQSVDGLWLTQVTLSGTQDETKLQGRARHAELVPTYLQELASRRPFAVQRFQQFQINRPEDADADTVEFSINSEPFDRETLAAYRQ